MIWKKNLVSVVIILKIPPQEVLNIHLKFLLLKDKQKLVAILDEDKDYQVHLLKLNDYHTKKIVLTSHKYGTKLNRKNSSTI